MPCVLVRKLLKVLEQPSHNLKEADKKECRLPDTRRTQALYSISAFCPNGFQQLEAINPSLSYRKRKALLLFTCSIEYRTLKFVAGS